MEQKTAEGKSQLAAAKSKTEAAAGPSWRRPPWTR